MSETTFENAKVGDRVWSVEFGWGTVKYINNEYQSLFIKVIFDENDEDYGLIQYELHGLKLDHGLYTNRRTLFWDEIKIVPPTRPKRTVVKFVRRYGVYTKNGDVRNTFDDEADAKTFAALTGGIVVELTGKLEVEE